MSKIKANRLKISTDKMPPYRHQRVQMKARGRTLLETLGVLSIIGVLSITALVGFTYAMNKHRANETIYDVMLRGTNVPMIDENYATRPVGHEFLFPSLGTENGRRGVYYPMVTQKDDGSSYYVEVTEVTYRVCKLILDMKPTDIDQIVVNETVFTGDSSVCGRTDGLALRFCFGSDGTVCDGTGVIPSGSGSGEPLKPCETDADCDGTQVCRSDKTCGCPTDVLSCGPCEKLTYGTDGCASGCTEIENCVCPNLSCSEPCTKPNYETCGCDVVENCTCEDLKCDVCARTDYETCSCIPTETPECGACQEVAFDADGCPMGCQPKTCQPCAEGQSSVGTDDCGCDICSTCPDLSCAETSCTQADYETCTCKVIEGCTCEDGYQQTPTGECLECPVMNLATGNSYEICLIEAEGRVDNVPVGSYGCCCTGGGEGWHVKQDGSGECISCVPPKVFDGYNDCTCSEGAEICGGTCCGAEETCIEDELGATCCPNERACIAEDAAEGTTAVCCPEGETCMNGVCSAACIYNYTNPVGAIGADCSYSYTNPVGATGKQADCEVAGYSNPVSAIKADCSTGYTNPEEHCYWTDDDGNQQDSKVEGGCKRYSCSRWWYDSDWNYQSENYTEDGGGNCRFDRYYYAEDGNSGWSCSCDQFYHKKVLSGVSNGCSSGQYCHLRYTGELCTGSLGSTGASTMYGVCSDLNSNSWSCDQTVHLGDLGATECGDGQYCRVAWTGEDCSGNLGSTGASTMYGKCAPMDNGSLDCVVQHKINLNETYLSQGEGCDEGEYCRLAWTAEGCSGSLSSTGADTMYGVCSPMGSNSASCPQVVHLTDDYLGEKTGCSGDTYCRLLWASSDCSGNLGSTGSDPMYGLCVPFTSTSSTCPN